jgi:AcrR family transcriptional regulator
MPIPRLSRVERARRTRLELLAAANRVFATKGFDRATVDDVAEAAGFTKGAIYSNFASKSDLMLALIQERIAVQSEAAAGVFAGASLEEVLRRLYREDSGPDVAGPEWLMLVAEFVTYAMRDERARVALAAQYERARAISAAMIAEKYREAGMAPPFPPRDIAILIEAIGVGVGIQALIDPAGVSMDLRAVALRRLLGDMPTTAAGGAAAPATDPGKDERRT